MAAMKLSDIRGLQRQGVVAEGQANTITSLDAYSKAYASAQSPQERAIFQGLIEGTLTGAQAAGFYAADDIEKLRLSTQRNIPVNVVQHDLRTIGPQATLANLEKRNYQGLQDEDYLTLKNNAIAQWHAQIAEQKLKEAQAQNAITPWDTNPIVWGKIFFGIQKGTINIDGKDTPVAGDQWVGIIRDAFEKRQLSMEQTKQLEAMVSEGTFQDVWFKQTEKLYKDSFGWQEAFQTFSDPSAIAPHHQAMAELLAAIQDEGLRGRAIFNRGIEILKPYLNQYGEDQAKTSTKREGGPNIPEWIRSKTVLPLGEKLGVPWWVIGNKPYEEKKKEGQPAPAGPQRQSGETIDDYLKRTKK